MKILLVSEGAHEIGGSAGEIGALEILVRRHCPGSAADITTRRVNDPSVKTAGGRENRWFGRCLAWLREAERSKFDLLVFVVDHDGDPDGRVAALRLAQEERSASISIPRAFGLAIRTFDAWMLADTTATTSAVGHPVPTSPDPERIDEPKRLFESMVRGVGESAPVREIYARVAAQADLAVLARRCPRGFESFRKQLLAAAVSPRA